MDPMIIGETYQGRELVKLEERLESNGKGKKKRKRMYYHMRCKCGGTFIWNKRRKMPDHCRGCNVTSGKKTHGMSYDARYKAYYNMLSRCYNEKYSGYKNYGGKGITVCEEWKDDINVFFAWSKENGYQLGLTLDRIDNSLGYSPDNCRRVTWIQQGRNRGNNVMYKGKTISYWCEKKGMSRVTYENRINHLGWSIKKALSTPVRKYKKQ